jgi:hypothetical protein
MTAIISQAEAKSLGLKRYFTGKPCKHGHVCERYICSSCVECAVAKSQSWAKANSDKKRQANKKWKNNNKEADRSIKRKWKKENRAKCKKQEEQWRSKYPEKVKAFRNKTLNKHRKKYYEKNKEYMKKNKESIYAERRKKYRIRVEGDYFLSLAENEDQPTNL